MNLAYSLTQDISCEKICRDIQKLIQQESSKQHDMTTKVLIINLVDLAYTSDELQLKLEYKSDN